MSDSTSAQNSGVEGNGAPAISAEPDHDANALTVPATTIANEDEAPIRSREHTRTEHIDVPGYEIVNELGRGGMGVVYRARHRQLNRDVALKMIIAGPHASDNDLARFRAEAEAAARLQHSGIVQIYEIGDHNGLPFLALELCPGGSLAELLAGTPLPCKQAAHIVKQVARAVHVAHHEQIIHRDLKPANVLLGSAGEVKISDFGLAKRLDKSSGNTASGAVMGTPSYMAPEQAAGNSKQIGPVTDVYALGAILYECLTGRPPFRAATAMDTLMQVMSDDPVPPRLLNPKVDADLETICLKCLEKQPASRYASAEEVAVELERYLSGESITARSFNVLDRLARVLDRSQHDASLHAWSSILFILAGIILVGHLLVFTFAQFGLSEQVLTAARFGQFLLLGMLFLLNRRNQLFPRTSAERELWTIWIGYMLGYGSICLTVHMLVSAEILAHGPNAPRQWENLLLYPISSVLAGMAFFIMGSNYWGRCYAIGVAFMIMAVVNTYSLNWAPLQFGLLWGVALMCLGWHLRHLHDQAEEEKKRALYERR